MESNDKLDCVMNGLDDLLKQRSDLDPVDYKLAFDKLLEACQIEFDSSLEGKIYSYKFICGIWDYTHRTIKPLNHKEKFTVVQRLIEMNKEVTPWLIPNEKNET